MVEPDLPAVGCRQRADVRHWTEDPRLNELDSDGTRLTPVVVSKEYDVVGSWDEERAHLVGVIRYLVLEVRELFERVPLCQSW